MDKYNTEGENIKYKVGDIVTVISNLKEVNAARQEAGKETWPDVTSEMLECCGKSFEIAYEGECSRAHFYRISDKGHNIYDYGYNWAPWMLTSRQCASTRTKNRSIKF